MAERVIRLRHASIEFTNWGCETTFKDGGKVQAWPHDDAHYRVVAARLGYQDDVLAYCQEHDLLHSLVAQWIMGTESPVLRGVATGRELSGTESAYEECFVQAMQRFIRANERPILANLPLDDWKAEALEMLRSV